MPLQPNQDYWSISQSKPEPALDPYYYRLHLARSPQAGFYTQNAICINDCLINIKRHKYPRLYYTRLHRLLLQSTGYTEFECFLYACDCDKVTLLKDTMAFRQAVTLYLKNRRVSNIRRSISQTQALIDRSVTISRQRGEPTKDKLRSMIATHTRLSLNTVDSDCLILSSNTHSNSCLIKVWHVRASGGGQTYHKRNLIAWLNAPNGQQTYSCAFVDGIYSNSIISDPDIQAALTNNPSAFWLNTAGFKQFAADFI